MHEGLVLSEGGKRREEKDCWEEKECIIERERERDIHIHIHREREKVMTWTMAMCKRSPLSPIAMEAAAMTAGPVRNLTAMAKAAMEFPHAMILGCKAIKRPVMEKKVHTYQNSKQEKKKP